MVHHAGRLALTQQVFKLCLELCSRLELAVCAQVLAEGPVQRTRNMAGHRVQRLDLAFEARCGPRVQQRLSGPAQVGSHSLGVQQAGSGFFQGKKRGCPGWLLAGRHGAARGLPGLQAAVEYGHRLMAGPLEHPPEPAAVVGAVAVIHHGLHVVGQTNAGQPEGKALAAGQRMPPAGSCFMQAGFGAERMVQVRIHSARNVCLRIVRSAGVGLHQVETAVKHQAVGGCCKKGLELFGRDQVGVHVESLPESWGLQRLCVVHVVNVLRRAGWAGLWCAKLWPPRH